MAALERARSQSDALEELWGRGAGAARALASWATRFVAPGLALCGLLSVSAGPHGASQPWSWTLLLGGLGLWGLRPAIGRLVRRRLPELAGRVFRSRWTAAGARELPVGGLGERALGTPVIVRGRVRALRRLPDPTPAASARPPAVWSHVRFSVVPWSPRQRTPFVYDLAEDFEIVGEDGVAVRVAVGGAHLVARGDAPRIVAEEHECRLLALVPPAPGRWLFPGDRALIYQPSVEACDIRLREGDAVTVFGVLDQVVAPESPRGAREAPLEPCLRGLPGRPLVVVAG